MYLILKSYFIISGEKRIYLTFSIYLEKVVGLQPSRLICFLFNFVRCLVIYIASGSIRYLFVISANHDFITQATVLYLNSDLVPEPFARKQFSKYYQKLCKLVLTDGCKIDIKMVHFNSLYWIWLLLLCLD